MVDASDTTAPTLTSIEDDQSGGPVAVPQAIVYTVTFDKPMSAGSVDVSDFENASCHGRDDRLGAPDRGPRGV